MAEEKVTFRGVFKEILRSKQKRKSYILFTLILLAIAFVLTYVNYTDYSLISAIIFIMILMPLVVTFAEYTAIIETGAEQPRRFRVYFDLFRNTYRSGRISVFFSWKTLLYFFLYIIGSGLVFMAGLFAFIYFFDQTLYTALFELFKEAQVTMSPEAYNELTNKLLNLFTNYNETIVMYNQLMLILGIIFVLNRGVFHVYLSLFIEHRQGVRFQVLKDAFASDAPTKQKIIRTQVLLTTLAFSLYTLLYIGAYYVLKYFVKSDLNFLQAELIALVAFGLIIPFTTRYHFFFYHQLMEPKRIDILRFSISELKAMIKNPNLPENTINYITQILAFRENELASRLNQEEVVSADEKGEEKEKDFAPIDKDDEQ